jgi:flagellar motility protein MotE (MotC chaperone)
MRRQSISFLIVVAAGGFGAGAEAQQGWAPVVLVSPSKGSAQPAPFSTTTKVERPSRIAKVMPVEASPAGQERSPPALQLTDKASPHGTPAEAVKAPKPPGKSEAAQAEPMPKVSEAASAGMTPAQQYCANIADAAADARFAWQKKALTEVQQEVDKRIARLEAKIAEYQKWLARRDEFSKKAQDSLVSIYSKMRPDAAASQLVKMDEETAAAVLLKLDPRIASTILNEIPAPQAARLTGTISGAARTTTDKKKS